jgi:hypothetical protein
MKPESLAFGLFFVPVRGLRRTRRGNQAADAKKAAKNSG